MRVKEESEKVGLKLNIQKMKIMASGPITSCEKMGKQWKQYQTFFFFLAPKSLRMVTAAMKLKDTYSLKKSYDQPRQHIKKQRYFVQRHLCPETDKDLSLVFPVVMYECESWTIKKAEH